ncbi:DUF4258 domain-containing protein [Thiorhodococcus minor]|uniref:DUF4258 domain-containing protein n=1 Tax=Thiorhodococcus minor TaxID=57489 RepID=UPI001ADD42A9|nr:DUF4258 domain-containing protein [Thiorhodococcus minor]
MLNSWAQKFALTAHSLWLQDMIITAIQEKIRSRSYEFSRHAVDQSIRRDISVGELEEALVGNIEIIEDYPDDKYGPSCLVLGYTSSGRALHVLCSYPSRPILKVITIYEPDPNQWIDDRIRIS